MSTLKILNFPSRISIEAKRNKAINEPLFQIEIDEINFILKHLEEGLIQKTYFECGFKGDAKNISGIKVRKEISKILRRKGYTFLIEEGILKVYLEERKKL